MGWTAEAWIAVGALVISLAGMQITALVQLGRVLQTVDELRGSLASMRTDLKELEGKVDRHGTRITRLEPRAGHV